MISDLLQRIENIEQLVKSTRSVNINKTSTKEAIIDAARYYFQECRPKLTSSMGEADPILQFDENWQHIIRLAHGNNPKSSYDKLIRNLKRFSKEFSIRVLSSTDGINSRPTRITKYSDAEATLIKTLGEIVPSAALSYKQGLEDLTHTGRISFRGTACEFRETLRETLDHLAPDSDVTSEPNFQFEKNQIKPTMKQKVRFILKSRGLSKNKRLVTEKSLEFIESLFAEITRALYDRASISTHVNTSREEVFQLKRYLDTVLFDLLEIAEPAKLQ